MSKTYQRWLALLAILFFSLGAANVARADPPYRAARLAWAEGGVSFSPAGESEWINARVNRPIIPGDRLWVDSGARAELQIDGAALRFGALTQASMLNIDDRITQVRLTQGVLHVRVWRIARDQYVEIDTPNLAFVIREPGSYRIEVDDRDLATAVVVREGRATAYGEGRAFRVGNARGYRFYDTRLADFDVIATRGTDNFDRWVVTRDDRVRKSASVRYVSRDVVGYEDLDAYGNWRTVNNYGSVWFPSKVQAGWAPYRDGHWAWIEPWGWTWIDDQPWGYAPSHYGRWAYIDNRWGWVPGPVQQRAVYAPALVAFIGGSNFSVSVSSGATPAVAWVPLAPREIYRPTYRVSRDYFARVNTSNTAVNVTQVTNVYNVTNVNVTYVNRQVPDAVVVVPRNTFVQARPVARERVRVEANVIAAAPVAVAVPVAPQRDSVMSAPTARQRPPAEVVNRPVVAQTAPPPPPPAVETRIGALANQAGKPLEPASATRAAAPAAGASAPVKVVEAAPAASAPASAPPARERGERGGRDRGERGDRGDRPAGAASAPAPGAAPASAPGAAPAAPSAASAPAPAASRTQTPAPGAPAAGAASTRAAQPAPAQPAASASPAPAAAASRPTESRQPASRPADTRGDQRQPDQRQQAPQPAPSQPAASAAPGRGATPGAEGTRGRDAAPGRDGGAPGRDNPPGRDGGAPGRDNPPGRDGSGRPPARSRDDTCHADACRAFDGNADRARSAGAPGACGRGIARNARRTRHGSRSANACIATPR